MTRGGAKDDKQREAEDGKQWGANEDKQWEAKDDKGSSGSLASSLARPPQPLPFGSMIPVRRGGVNSGSDSARSSQVGLVDPIKAIFS